MDQTPQRLPYDFNEKFRGYDIDEVDAYLLQLSGQLDALGLERDDALARAGSAEQEIVRLREALSAAQAAAADAAAPAQAVVAPSPSSVSDEATAAEAARTLMLASQTAERAVAEAKSDAAKLVADATTNADRITRDARVEADRVVSAARASADQMTQEASEQAAREYGARRDEVLAEIATLDSERASSVTQLAAIETRVEEYRAALSGLVDHITAALDSPERMLRPPLPGIELPAPAQFRDTATDTAVDTGTGGASSPQSPTFLASAETGSSVSDPVVAAEPGEAQPAPAIADTFDSAESAEAESGAYGTDAGAPVPLQYLDPEAESASVDPGSFVVETDPVDFDTPSPLPAAEAFGEDSPAASPVDHAGFDTGFDEGWESPSEPQSQGASDPWAPGSWREVSGLSMTSDGFTPEPQPDYGVDAFAGDEPVAAVGLPEIGEDRYAQDLHEALAVSDGGEDEAMERFFGGDDERQTRRFGRRR